MVDHDMHDRVISVYMAFRDEFFPNSRILGRTVPRHRAPNTMIGGVAHVQDQAKEE